MRAYGIQDCSRERQLCVFQAQLREAVVISSSTAARGAVISSKIAAARGSCTIVCVIWYSCERQLCVRVFSGTAARGSCAIVFQVSSGRVDGAVLCFTNICLHFTSFILPSCERCSCVMSITRPHRRNRVEKSFTPQGLAPFRVHGIGIARRLVAEYLLCGQS